MHIFICYNYTYDDFNECKIKSVNNEGKRLKASKSFNGNLNREILYNYFYNLVDYQANNIGGSCTFVSLTSVLSYYDSIKMIMLYQKNMKERITMLEIIMKQ